MGKQHGSERPSFLTTNLHVLTLMLAFMNGAIFWSVYERHAEARALRAYEADRHGQWGGTPVHNPCGPDGPSTDIEFFTHPACLATLSRANLLLMRNQAANMVASKSVNNIDQLERVLRAIEQELARRQGAAI